LEGRELFSNPHFRRFTSASVDNNRSVSQEKAQLNRERSRSFGFAAMSSLSQLTYEARASKHRNPLARRLFTIASEKKSNVVVSADVTTSKELLDLAECT
jgi:hypothetical protein